MFLFSSHLRLFFLCSADGEKDKVKSTPLETKIKELEEELEEQQHHNMDATVEVEEVSKELKDVKKQSEELKVRLNKALEGQELGEELKLLQEKVNGLEAEKTALNAKIESLDKSKVGGPEDGPGAEKAAADLVAMTKQRDELLAAKKALVDAGSAEARVHELEEQLRLYKENTELKANETEKAIQTLKERVDEQQKERDANMIKYHDKDTEMVNLADENTRLEKEVSNTRASMTPPTAHRARSTTHHSPPITQRRTM